MATSGDEEVRAKLQSAVNGVKAALECLGAGQSDEHTMD